MSERLNRKGSETLEKFRAAMAGGAATEGGLPTVDEIIGTRAVLEFCMDPDGGKWLSSGKNLTKNSVALIDAVITQGGRTAAMDMFGSRVFCALAELRSESCLSRVLDVVLEGGVVKVVEFCLHDFGCRVAQKVVENGTAQQQVLHSSLHIGRRVFT